MRADRKTLELVDSLEREGRAVVRRPALLAEEPPTAPAEDPASEKELQADVVRFAKRHGWLVYHTTDSRKSAAGFPDLILLRGSVLIVAELKTATGKVTADQATWLESFRAAGVATYLWRPGDWLVIQRVLSAPATAAPSHPCTQVN